MAILYEIINEKDFQKARKKIQEAKAKGKTVVFTGSDDELNRKVLEKEKIDVFLPVLKDRRDKQKQRDSGFNQVLAKTAAKKSVALGIDLEELAHSPPKEKIEILARIAQNIRICNKNKINIVFLSKKDKYDLKALGLTLGAPTWMTKEL